LGFGVGVAIDRASNAAMTTATRRKRLAIVGEDKVKKCVDGLKKTRERLVHHGRFYVSTVGVLNECLGRMPQ
jgi:hypothetical protein